MKSVENVITLGKLIGLLFLFCLLLLSILFLKTKRNDLACPVMGTIFLVNEISRKLQLNSPDSTAPTLILGTPPLLLRHNEPNPIRSTTGHMDTLPIWTDKTLSLYGFINEISRKLPLFSTDSTTPTHIHGTPPLFLRLNEMNLIQSVRPQKTNP